MKDELFTNLGEVGYALSNQYRLRVISLLCHGPKTVEQLVEAIEQSKASTSAHLKVLRTVGLVRTEKKGKYVWYRLATPEVESLWLTLRDTGEGLLPQLRESRVEYESHDKLLSPLQEEELWGRLQSGSVFLVDLRPPEEYELCHLPSAINLPFAELDRRIHELPKKKPFLAYCRGPYCGMALAGTSRIAREQLPVQRLRFSVPEWRKMGFPLEGRTVSTEK